MSRGFRWALALMVIATVAGIVGGVRSRTGSGGLWLTVGRELVVQGGDDQNTGRSLRWVSGLDARGGRARPVSDGKPMIAGRTLDEIGLSADTIADQLPRQRFLVLTLVEPDSGGASRLSIADAGVDINVLLVRYPDDDRYLIVPAIVSSWRVVGDGVSLFASLNPNQLHLPTEIPLGGELLVRSGRGGIPYIADSRP
jgi:hypothetical protein